MMLFESFYFLSIDLFVGNIAIKNSDTILIEKVYKELSSNLSEMFHVYKAEEILSVYKIKDSKYMLDLVLISKIQAGHVFALGADDDEFLDLYHPRPESSSQKIDPGSHGYDDITKDYNEQGKYPDVRAAFMAIGPDFKKGYSQPWIKLIDEYQIMMKVVKVQPLDHEGNMERVQGMFNHSLRNVSSWLLVILLVVFKQQC